MAVVDRHPLKEKRRANKPLLERKRRARINDSLSDLKHLVLTSLNKDAAKYAKMEKVDILDMTVKFLKGQKFEPKKADYASVYRAGYNECTNEIYQSIMTMDGVDHSMKCKILTSIASNVSETKRCSPPPSPTISHNSRSPIPSPIQQTLSPQKQCVSEIFNPKLTPLQRPVHLSAAPTLTMPSLTKDTYNRNMTPCQTRIHVPTDYSHQTIKREQYLCMDSQYFCQENGQRNFNTKPSSAEVWRPW